MKHQAKIRNSGLFLLMGLCLFVSRVYAFNPPPIAPAVVPVDTLIAITINGGAALSARASGFTGTVFFTWSQISKPDAAPAYTSITNTSGRVTINTIFTVVGVYKFKIRAYTNSPANSAEDTVTVIVKPPIKAPVLILTNDTTLTLPVNNFFLKAWVKDTLDKVDVTWLETATNPKSLPTVLPRKIIKKWYQYAVTDTLNIGNLIDKAGRYVFKVEAKDETGSLSTDSIVVTVNDVALPPNLLPIIETLRDTTITLPTNSVTLTGKATDPDGSIVKYVWEQDPADILQATLTPVGASGISASNLQMGVYHLILIVTDNKGATDSAKITITVLKPRNQAPVITLAALRSLTLPEDSLMLTATVSDPDGDPVNMRWTQIAGKILAANDSASVEDGAFLPNFPTFLKRKLRLRNLKEGEYIFRLFATDNQGGSAFADVTVVVSTLPPQPISVSIPKDTILTAPIAKFVIVSQVSNPDKVPLVYKWKIIEAPIGTTLNEENGGQNSSMQDMAIGVYKIQLTVSDGKNEYIAVMNIEVKAGELKLAAKRVLSPNGDGQNETWSIEGIDDFPELKVTVINEEGKVVFSALSYSRANEWDGRNNGKDLPEGAYYYMIRDNQNNIIQKGSLLLVR